MQLLITNRQLMFRFSSRFLLTRPNSEDMYILQPMISSQTKTNIDSSANVENRRITCDHWYASKCQMLKLTVIAWTLHFLLAPFLLVRVPQISERIIRIQSAEEEVSIGQK